MHGSIVPACHRRPRPSIARLKGRAGHAHALHRIGCPHSILSRSWYDPLKKETNLNAPALKKWIANGAVPSDTVKTLLQRAAVIAPEPPRVYAVKKEAVKAEVKA